MFKRIVESLLGLDRGYFDQPGELGRHWFDPHWPGPLLGAAGSWHNYVLALATLGLLILLFRRTPNRRLENVRHLLALGAAIFVPILLMSQLGAHSYTVAPLVLIAAIVVYLFYTQNRAGMFVAGRLALFGFFLMLLSGTLAWNLVLAAAAGLLILWVYRHEGRALHARILLGVLRTALAAFVLILLNNPVLTRTTKEFKPSVVAVLVDRTLSMSVKDMPAGSAGSQPTRMEAVVDLLAGQNQALLKKLAKIHVLRFYGFDSNARQIGAFQSADDAKQKNLDPEKIADANASLIGALRQLKPDGASTQVIPSIITVLNDLQGERLAGVVVMTDGRDTPSQPPAEIFHTLSNYGVKVYPVTVGSDAAPKNIVMQSVSVQESVFKDDVVNLKFTVAAQGYEAGHPVKVKLIDKDTKLPLHDQNGRPAEVMLKAADGNPMEEELLFRPDKVGPLNIQIEADAEPGEIDAEDNIRLAQTSVLDASINVLYIDGYPRWEYRYIKNEMIRDNTVNISCYLTSADSTFLQEGDEPIPSAGQPDAGSKFPGRIARFPVSMDELMLYDLILVGDVDPREFSDAQLQLISEFVSKKGGGFGMIAGPKFAPVGYKNTPIDLLLPVNIAAAQPDPPNELIVDGFRPVLSRQGADSSIFRFYADRKENEKFIKEQLQPLFWYSRGIIAKPTVGEVYASHPNDLAPDGTHAPILVLGRFGAGRTLFSAIDDSWRWRYYTGEGVFDTYWVQQLRYLARGKKLGQRKVTFTSDRQTYQQGEQIRLGMRVLDSILLQQLPQQIRVELIDESDGQVVRADKLQKDASQPNYYTTSFAADRLGRFTLRLPEEFIPDPRALDQHIDVIVPRLELVQPQVNRVSLQRLAAESGGQALSYDEARTKLPDLIQSAARTIALVLSVPLWNTRAAMLIFVLLVTAEWVLRKVYGMV